MGEGAVGETGGWAKEQLGQKVDGGLGGEEGGLYKQFKDKKEQLGKQVGGRRSSWARRWMGGGDAV